MTHFNLQLVADILIPLDKTIAQSHSALSNLFQNYIKVHTNGLWTWNLPGSPGGPGCPGCGRPGSPLSPLAPLFPKKKKDKYGDVIHSY